MTRLLTLLCTLILVSACQPKKAAVTSVDGRVSPIYQGPSELAYCTPVTYSGAVSVTGTAKFRRRNPWGNTSTGGLGSASTSGTHPATEHPIRKAEIRVTDSADNLVQCGETGTDGTFTLSLPGDGNTYTVSVNSRSNNSSYLRASVLDRPERNQLYSIQTTVTTSGSIPSLQLMAAADGEVLGAAFNILDQLYEANSFLRTNLTSIGFTSAPKVSAYWEKGFNPNSYFGDSGGISFYLPGYARLFILGGLDGDVNSSDTDHFDNSVILHEYGHFLEDYYFPSDSPGGSHNGNRIIDPRLAWSEGWGNFFQAAVSYAPGSTPYYIDTLGNDDGVTEQMFHVSLESPPLNPGSASYGTPCYSTTLNTYNGDCPRELGEGNFREFSVTRMLWDMIDTVADDRFGFTESISDKFSEIWGVLVAQTNGFRDPKLVYKNVGHFHLSHDRLYSGTVITGVRGVERQKGDTSDYADYVEPAGTCTMSIKASGSTEGAIGDTGSFGTSDLFRNNDFYHIVTNSAQTLTLEYTLGTTSVDLDLFVYNESAQYGVSQDIVAYQRNDPTLNALNTETVTLPAGTHLINVMVYTPSSVAGTTITYELKLNGTKLCPSTLVR